MAEQLIKSAERVKDHGEVFTPKWVVDKMLDQPEIAAKVADLSATFLEPSAGEGAFLVEILRRRLQTAADISSTADTFGINALRGLSTLYGIELLEDNVEMLVMNMASTFERGYTQMAIAKFQSVSLHHVVKSARTLIKANMAQGDALTGRDATGAPILLSEWQPVGQTKVRRVVYTFDAIKNGGGPVETVRERETQISMFPQPESPEPVHRQYAVCKWTDIYKEKIKEQFS